MPLFLEGDVQQMQMWNIQLLSYVWTTDCWLVFQHSDFAKMSVSQSQMPQKLRKSSISDCQTDASLVIDVWGLVHHPVVFLSC